MTKDQTTRNITTVDVFNRMVELADKEPDFNYKSQEVIGEDGIRYYWGMCSYLGVDTAHPDMGRPCIVGQALTDLGVTRDELRELEGHSATDALRGLGITGPETYMDAISSAQTTQDNHNTWGDAIRIARESLD